MIREAALFVMAEQVLVEVVGRIRPEHGAIVMPPPFDPPADARSRPLRPYVRALAQDDARLPELLAGGAPDPADSDPGPYPPIVEAACAAASEVTDGDAVVHADSGDVTTSDFLLRTTIARCFIANDIAMHLGSRACPLTEQLARGMWEGTEPRAAHWRLLGVFRDPLPLPPHVSWRDRFMLTAGHDPHALDH